MTDPLLQVRDLTIVFEIGGKEAPVVNDLSFEIGAGETLGIVGESGCGKSMTALALLGLVPQPSGRIASGSILFDGRDLTQLSERQMEDIRGNDISMVFQEPMTSLNPVFSVGEQIAETVRTHQSMTRMEAEKHAVEMLGLVGIPSPEQRVREFPHQLSGGMRQRVMIAIALACRPKLLVADEPTTALDVTVQAQIFDLFSELQDTMGTAILMITHDIGVIAKMTKHVMAMYAGRRIEGGRTRDVLRNPQHPYTQGLINCVPHLMKDPPETLAPLFEIPGMVPPVTSFANPGCMFAPRCQHRMDKCTSISPTYGNTGAEGHGTACWLYEET